MNTKHLYRFAVLILGTALLMFTGCVGGTSKPSDFYLLKALPEIETTELKQTGISLEIGPITMPAYLDRTQIATIGNDHRLNMNQFHRWAEPLKESFNRILADNLAFLLKTVNVYEYPHRRDVSIDFQVEIAVSRFSADKNGKAILAVYWSLIGSDEKTVISRKRSSITAQAKSKTIEAIVAAQNRTIEELSREIAGEIKKKSEK